MSRLPESNWGPTHYFQASRRERKRASSPERALEARFCEAKAYSLSPVRAGGRNRTDDLLITSELLYQLSYSGSHGTKNNGVARLTFGLPPTTADSAPRNRKKRKAVCARPSYGRSHIRSTTAIPLQSKRPEENQSSLIFFQLSQATKRSFVATDSLYPARRCCSIGRFFFPGNDALQER